jgi:hypothetical protein
MVSAILFDFRLFHFLTRIIPGLLELSHQIKKKIFKKYFLVVPDHADTNIDGIRIWNISYYIQWNHSYIDIYGMLQITKYAKKHITW